MLKNWLYNATFIVFAVFLFKNSHAQTDQRVYDLKNVIPPSPNAASLGKYANWPVNLYTGLAEISIPIYELKGRSISVPVSLSYHASGIKVGEHASSVGLGWSLQAGGVITRSVRGIADEDPGPGYRTLRTYYNNPGDLTSGSIASGTSAYSDSMLRVSVANGNMDSEPDLYMFSALGKSYKFYFAGDGTIVTQPYSNLKFSFSYTDSSWIVLMEDGTKLKFGGTGNYKEITQTNQTNVVSDPYISSWYLQSITSTTGEVVNFKYSVSTGITTDSYFYQTDYLPGQIVGGTNPVTTKTPVSKASTQTVNMLNLASIETDLGKIIFDTTNSRLDLPGAASITGIRIFSKLQAPLIRKFKLYYTYSTATGGNTYPYGYSTPPYRLRLDTLEEISSDSAQHKFWKFEYNPLSLPSRKSFAQDYWGYYNGAVNNTTMLPYIPSFNPYVYNTGNRSGDSASMMAEMLTKVTYPTGGYSQFNYEPNSISNNVEQFTTTPVSQQLLLAYNQSNFTNKQTTSFTITKGQYVQYQFNCSFSTTYLNDYGPSTTLTTASINNSLGSSVSSLSFLKAENNTTKTANVFLTPGTYTLTDSCISPQSEFSTSAITVQMNSNFTYLASQGFKNVNTAVGGVRIKSIFDYDNVDNTKSINRFFTYENGFLAYPVDSVNDYLTTTTDNAYSCTIPGSLTSSVNYATRNTTTKFSLGSIQGGPIGYGKVTERFGANGENGKNVYYYSAATDGNIVSATILPYIPVISMDFARGLLLEKDVYTTSNALVTKSLNTYQFNQRNSITTYKVAYKVNSLSACYVFYSLGEIITRTFYQDKAYQVLKTSSSEIKYNVATGDSLVATTYYFYDDTLNMQPTRMVTLSSKGDSVITYARTALEKASINASISLSPTASTAIDSMVARNMVANTLESEKYVKNILSTKSVLNYKVQPNGFVQEDNVMYQNANNALETRVQFSRYDNKGNLAEQSKAGDVRHNYIWDYQGTYPVAELINGDSLNMAYTSFEADGSGNWVIGSGVRDSVTTAITGAKSYNLGNGSITKSGLSSSRTYRISYWTTNSSAYSIPGALIGYPSQGKKLGVWTYFEHRINGQTSVTLSGTGNIDELRLYPDSAQMTTFTYNPLIGVSSACDVNNRVTYYKYDAFSRLNIIFDQDGNAVKKFCYGYNGQAIACTQFYNSLKTQSFTRNNCTPGYTASSVIDTVPAGKYVSLLSQADADLQAQNDINANGQNNANTKGTCTLANVTITAVNNTALSGFTATFVNTSTLAQTVFSVPAAGGTLGTLAPGTYNVTLAKTGNTTVKYIYTVCTTSHAAAVSSTFSSMAISVSCSTVQIDTVN